MITTTTLALLFVAVFTIERLSEWLNLQSSRKPLPATLKEVQSPEEQARAAEYLSDRTKLSVAKETFFLLLFLTLLFTGFFGMLEWMAIFAFESTFWRAAAFAGALILGQGFFSLPFSAYSTFVIEQRYGFNRTTWKTFLGDAVKAVLVGTILGGLIFYFAVRMFEGFGENAWWVFWLGYTAFQFFIVWIAPVTLLPLFLKLEPMKDGELLQAIEKYASEQNFKLDGVWVCDASRRSAKSNAFFTGFGRFRRLVLFDTLISKHPVSEIVAIVAHEAGHFKLGHIWKGSLLSAVTSLVIFYLLQRLVASPDLYQAFHVSPGGNVGIGLVLGFMVLGKLMYFISPLTAYFSRRNEYSADRFSMSTTRNPAALVAGLKRLVSDNLATLQQHPLHVSLHATHPPLPDRIKPLTQVMTGASGAGGAGGTSGANQPV